MSRLLILGGGFAGMWAALTAAHEAHRARRALDITLVSRDEYLTVRPRLYEPFDVAMRTSLRPVLEPLGVRIVTDEIERVDAAARRVAVAGAGGATTFDYDRLVLATGSAQRPLAIPGGADHTYDIDTFGGAGRFDARLREVLADPARDGALTFVIVGAGFTGIELATDMRHRIRVHADAFLAERARIVLVERGGAVGPDLGALPRPILEAALREVRVEVRLGATLTAIDADGVVLAGGERIPTRTVVVTAGLAASALTAALPAERDAQGRIVVDDYLRVPTVPAVFVAGDAAHAKADDRHVALMSCQHAVPMGKHAGYNAARELLGLEPRIYRQPAYVTCLDLGDAGAMLTSGWDREPQQTGAETKALKRTINTQWIYPPQGSRDDLLAASDIDAVWPPGA